MPALQSRDSLVQNEQTLQLYAGLPTALGATFVLSSALAAVQWQYISHTVLVSWWIGLLLVTLGRGWLVYRFRTRKPSAVELPIWYRRFLIGTASASVLWGLAGVLLFPPAEPTHQVFLAFVIAGITAGGVTVLSASRTALLVFLPPLLIPLTLRFLLENTPITLIMGGMILLFLILILILIVRCGTIAPPDAQPEGHQRQCGRPAAFESGQGF